MKGKQPKLVLRESCIVDVSKAWPAGLFVEMGAGTGHMSNLFLERGFHGACHDLGEDSRRVLRANFASARDRMQVADALDELPDAAFDYLFAFEVLEHIEDDFGVLCGWLRHLKPGGRVLLSVPAHARKYGRSDEITGHVRRYEKQELRELLAAAGMEQIRIFNYGFPITELTRPLSNWLIRSDSSYEAMTPEQRSIRSAQAQPKIIHRMLRLFSDKLMLPFTVVQRWFYRYDLGDGYVAWCVKPER